MLRLENKQKKNSLTQKLEKQISVPNIKKREKTFIKIFNLEQNKIEDDSRLHDEGCVINEKNILARKNVPSR